MMRVRIVRVSIVMDPPDNIPIQSQNRDRALRRNIHEMNLSHPVIKQVLGTTFIPGVQITTIGNIGIRIDIDRWKLIRGLILITQRIALDQSQGLGSLKGIDIVSGMRRSFLVPAISALGFIVAFADPRLSMMLYLLLIPGFFLVGNRQP